MPKSFDLTVTYLSVTVSVFETKSETFINIVGAVGVVVAAAAMLFMLKFASKPEEASDIS
ncbi:MAG: hypothetical protein J5999_03050 [Oscillospiraceae bacterium]|nr:hypothetical protein [Oscillospiraceae bacterium]